MTTQTLQTIYSANTEQQSEHLSPWSTCKNDFHSKCSSVHRIDYLFLFRLCDALTKLR